MRFLPVNLNALLVELDDLAQTLALLQSLQTEPVAGVEELIPAARAQPISGEPARHTSTRLASMARIALITSRAWRASWAIML